MYRAYRRFLPYQDEGIGTVILYLGDHDPSGLDMDRDIHDRLEIYGITDFEVIRIGLTKEQIDTYKPPPNPAKFSDPRATDYVEKHGHVSWEVDALPPQVLDKIVRESIERHMNMKRYNLWEEREEEIKEQLRKFALQVGDYDYRGL